MQKQLQQVAEFHRQIGETCSSKPTLLQSDPERDVDLARSLRRMMTNFERAGHSQSQLAKRAMMAIEELAEWIEAHEQADLVAAADAWADRMYVLLGDAVATGMPVDPLIDEVHRSNMTKLAANRQSGKGEKASQYSAPNIKGIVFPPN